jgi:hypothetical protein
MPLLTPGTDSPLHPPWRMNRLYRLRAELATGTYGGVTFERYQYKITNGSRIWYFVDHTPAAKISGRVLLERCEPGHPKQTDRTRKH